MQLPLVGVTALIQNSPVTVGRLAELSRSGSTLVTRALMGFGEDPTP